MNCPKCSAEMSEETRGGVRVDLCGVCFGVWFDGGELEDVHNRGGSQRLSGLPESSANYEPTGDSAHVRCPRCEGDILRIGRISKREVMRCTSCRGLYLPQANSRFKTSEESILDSAVGFIEEIVGSLF